MTSLERELLWLLRDMVDQHCTNSVNHPRCLFSGFIRVNSTAMRLLGKYGMIKIINDGGDRCVEGRLLPDQRAANNLNRVAAKEAK